MVVLETFDNFAIVLWPSRLPGARVELQALGAPFILGQETARQARPPANPGLRTPFSSEAQLHAVCVCVCRDFDGIVVYNP